MNERIKELAEQAGVTFDSLGASYTYGSLPDFLARFAELIRADERELCAKVCEQFEPESFYLGQVKAAAKAIRARGLAHHFYTYTTPQEKAYMEEMEQPTPKQSGAFLVTKRTFKCTGCLGVFQSALEAQYHSCKDNK